MARERGATAEHSGPVVRLGRDESPLQPRLVGRLSCGCSATRTDQGPFEDMEDIMLSQSTPLGGILSRLGSHEAYPWQALPWDGTFSKVLMFDPATGQTLELGKIDAGAVFPEHSHPSLQAQYLISGRLRLRSGEVIEPGAFNLIPPGRTHGPFEALEESISLKFFASVPEYVLSDGSRFRYSSVDGQPEPRAPGDARS